MLLSNDLQVKEKRSNVVNCALNVNQQNALVRENSFGQKNSLDRIGTRTFSLPLSSLSNILIFQAYDTHAQCGVQCLRILIE